MQTTDAFYFTWCVGCISFHTQDHLSRCPGSVWSPREGIPTLERLRLSLLAYRDMQTRPCSPSL